MADPVTNSILTAEEIQSLTKEILEAQKEYLPGFSL
jgi:alpha-galactosidase/6-phospho-beta-glucosidase family protein